MMTVAIKPLDVGFYSLNFYWLIAIYRYGGLPSKPWQVGRCRGVYGPVSVRPGGCSSVRDSSMCSWVREWLPPWPKFTTRGLTHTFVGHDMFEQCSISLVERAHVG